MTPNDTIQDIGRGLNYHRNGFHPRLEAIHVGKFRQVIVAQNDRWVRFGFEWFGEWCARRYGL